METNLLNVTPVKLKRQNLARKEIQVISTSIIRSCDALDFESFIQWFDDSHDFLYINAQGEWLNYSQYYEMMKNVFSKASSITTTTSEEKFIFLNSNSVLSTWTGRYCIILKGGLMFNYNRFICSTLFKKTNGKWRSIFRHESKLGWDIKNIVR